jgi:4-hydroxy-tetrahydrodipicolinate synthase
MTFAGSQVAIITPFTKNNKIDEKSLFDLVVWHKKEKTDAIVCCGTTGESPTLSEEEKIQVIKICLDASQGKIPVIAGTGSNNTAKTIELTQKAYDLGVAGCLVIVPYYNKPSQRGCLEHFKAVAKIGAKIILYHHPGRTGVKLLPVTLQKIKQTPNVISIKEASGDLSYIEDVNQFFPVLSGDDLLTVPIMKLGGIGAISVLANCVPNLFKNIIERCKEKKFDIAANLFEKIKPLCEAVFLETNPQGIKYALSLMGKSRPFLRLPLLEPPKEVRKKIEMAMQNLEII